MGPKNDSDESPLIRFLILIIFAAFIHIHDAYVRADLAKPMHCFKVYYLCIFVTYSECTMAQLDAICMTKRHWVCFECKIEPLALAEHSDRYY